MALPGKRFVSPDEVETQVFDWGRLQWLTEPRVTATDGITAGVVRLAPGKGHERHNHPGIEEILYVMEGEGDQMIDADGEKVQRIRKGDLVQIPADIFHGTVNRGASEMVLFAVYAKPGPEALLRSLPGCVIEAARTK